MRCDAGEVMFEEFLELRAELQRGIGVDP